jgi:hypothetical protein
LGQKSRDAIDKPERGKGADGVSRERPSLSRQTFGNPHLSSEAQRGEHCGDKDQLPDHDTHIEREQGERDVAARQADFR